MDDKIMDDKIRYVVQHTELIRAPRQVLATFGSSTISYWVITELMGNISVVRAGKVIAERPRIVTPSYLIRLEGFSGEARRYVEMLAKESPHEPGIFYRYKNEPKGMDVVSEPIGQVVKKLNEQLDERHDPLTVIIRAVEELWDVSVLVFVYQLTRSSIDANVVEFHRRGSLTIDSSGVPQDTRNYIEELFALSERNLSHAPKLVAELNRWGLFPEYEDRFFALFRR
jgi:hypothetical protein